MHLKKLRESFRCVLAITLITINKYIHQKVHFMSIETLSAHSRENCYKSPGVTLSLTETRSSLEMLLQWQNKMMSLPLTGKKEK